MIRPSLQCPCSGQYLEPAFQYDAPPAGETVFEFAGGSYRRGYLRCALCAHWFSDNDMDLSGLYVGAYVDNTYGARLRQSFERILALPPERSDNAARVACLIGFARNYFGSGKTPSLLDVGAGLGVFPYRMKEAGWRCTAIDPDGRATSHAREVIGIEAITADFMTLDTAGLQHFDVITFNKVLEHVPDPVAMLLKAGLLLQPGGFVYFEVPDAEAAAAQGPGREEFFIEHVHVFSPASVALLASRAGFRPLLIERVREPSSKFTLRAFAALSPP